MRTLSSFIAVLLFLSPASVSASDKCLADLDGDGNVDAADLADLLLAWGQHPGSPANFDGDGDVDAADLAKLLSLWGPCPAPELDPIGDQIVFLGSTLNLMLTASDPNEHEIMFGASPLPLPANMTLDAATGEVQFTPDAAQVGTFEITFSASAGELTDTETVGITVDVLPPGGPTILSGSVRDSDTEDPIAGIEVRVQGTALTTNTGPDGEFVLQGVPDDAQVLEVDGFALGYAFVAEPIHLLLEHELFPGQINEITRPVFLPVLGAPAGEIPPAGDVMLVSPDTGVTLFVFRARH